MGLFLGLAVLHSGRCRGQSSVHHFGTIAAAGANRPVALELLGTAPSIFQNYFDLYVLEASTNLRGWAHLTTSVRTNRATNSLIYIDAAASALPERFYRMPTNQLVTALAKPTGPNGVGRVTRLLTDLSRTNRYHVPTNSSFMMTVWYPAERPAGVLPEPYIEPPLAGPLSIAVPYSPGDNSNRLAAFFAYSVRDAPVARNLGPFPVILYSHGYGFHRQDNSEKMEELASHGFVAAAMDHEDCRLTVFPGGTAVPGIFSPSATDAQLAAAVADRVADDRFVLAELVRLNAMDPILAGKLDLSRLGAIGWSLGCSDLGEIARTDDRFGGVVMLEGYLQGASNLVRFGVPCPLLAIYREDSVGRTLFDKAKSNAYLGQAHLASHFEFKDLTELSFASDAPRRGAAAIRASTLSFFNKYLNDQNDDLLDDPTRSYPALFNWEKR